MKQVKLFIATTSVALCFVITNSCSQTTTAGSSPVAGVFAASTPCDDISKTLLKIPSGIQCNWIKWNLTLYQDPKTSAPADFKFIYVYGLSKQGTRDFQEGAKTVELKGKWTIGKGTNESAEAVVYKLNADSSQISLSFLKPDENLLHLLDEDKRLMIGDGAFSYTLNRINPVPASPSRLTLHTAPPSPVATDSSAVAIFDGRTACNSVLRELNGISAAGCQLTKYRLTLYRNLKTGEPTTFQLLTVYVGKGNNSYTNTGKWTVTRGTQTDPGAIVYQLQPDAGKAQVSLAFLKADNNILFFLDKERNLMVGNDYFSYTLNRAKK